MPVYNKKDKCSFPRFVFKPVQKKTVWFTLDFSEACFATTVMVLSVTVLLEETKPGCLIPGDT